MPAPLLLGELEAVERDGLHERPRAAAASGDGRPQAAARELDRLQPLGHEPLDLAEVDELVQGVDEEQRGILAAELELAARRLAVRACRDELGERGDRRLEDPRRGGRLELELDLAPVLG